MLFKLPSQILGSLTVAVLIATVASVWAQEPPPESSQNYPGSQPAVSNNVYGGGGWGGGYHASTAAEGYLQGMASAIDAQGRANLNNSLAARNMQEAYNRALDNRVKQVDTYRWRRDTALQRQEQEMYERRQKNEKWLAKKRLSPLTPQEFDPATGKVTWPMLLQDPKWDEYRKPLDELLAKRAQYGALSMDEYTTAVDTIKDWRMAVTAVRKEYPYNAVGDALRFLLRLNREVNHDLG